MNQLELLEKEFIISRIKKSSNINELSKITNISRRTLFRKFKKYNIDYLRLKQSKNKLKDSINFLESKGYLLIKLL